MILAAPRTGTDNNVVNEGTLQISESGGSLRFLPTTNGTTDFNRQGDADASLAFNGTMDLDLSAAEFGKWQHLAAHGWQAASALRAR